MPALWEQLQHGAAALSPDHVHPAHPRHSLHLNGLSTGSKAVLPEDNNVVARAARGNRKSGACVQPAPQLRAALGAATGMRNPREATTMGTTGEESPGLLRPLRLTRVPLRGAQHAPSPWPCHWHQCGLARHRSLLKVAVGSCDDPVLADQGAAAEVGSCAGLGREEEEGLGWLNTSKQGTGRGPLGAQPWHPAGHASA